MSHEYRWFDEFINKKGDFENIPKNKLFTAFLKRFGVWLFCLIMHVVFSKVVPFDAQLSETWDE